MFYFHCLSFVFKHALSCSERPVTRNFTCKLCNDPSIEDTIALRRHLMSRVHVDRLSAIESTLQKQYGNEQWNLFHFFIWIWIKYWISIKINSQTFVSTKSNSCLFIAIKFYVNTIRHVHEYMRMLSADALCLKMWSSRLGSVTNYEFIAQWSVDSVRHESVHITTRLQQVDCATFIPISWDQNSICCCRWRRKFVHVSKCVTYRIFSIRKNILNASK